MKKHLPRKPDEDGIEVKTLSDLKGYLLNGVICCDEPLKFDEHLGRTCAVVYELVKEYVGENRLVKQYTIGNANVVSVTTKMHSISVRG